MLNQQHNQTSSGTSRIGRTEEGDITFNMSRREGLLGMVLGTTAVAIGGLTGIMSDDKYADKVESLEKMRETFGHEAIRSSKSVLRSAIESTLFSIANIKLSDALERAHIVSGGKAAYHLELDTLFQKALLETHAIVLAPFVEELFFRVLPSAIIHDAKNPHMRWDVGLTSLTIFGLIHNLGKSDDGGYFVSLNSLPIQQLTLGAFCWYQVRTGGGVHAWSAHVLYNVLAGFLEPKEREGDGATEISSK
jgi:hypothetical protein